MDRTRQMVRISEENVRSLCCRRTGIGADGLLMVNKCYKNSLEFTYYNSDGKIASLCGNGARCVVKYVNDHKMVDGDVTMEACDGSHIGKIDRGTGLISISFLDIPTLSVKQFDDKTFLLNSGSPHYVIFVDDVHSEDVVSRGRAIRYSSEYSENGVNVNFVTTIASNSFFIRTYERGVEDETAACGTGCVAAAIAFSLKDPTLFDGEKISITARVKYGDMKISFKSNSDTVYDISLDGPAVHVFDGKIPNPGCIWQTLFSIT